MAITLAITQDQESELRELACRQDRYTLQLLLRKAVEPTAEALVAEASPLPARARLEHFLAKVRAEFPALSRAGENPRLPLTREEIYLDHD